MMNAKEWAYTPQYVATLDGSIDDIEERLEKADSPAQVQLKNIRYIGSRYQSVEIPSIFGDLESLERYLENDGLIESFEIEVETKRQCYLSQWDNFLKEKAMTPEQKAAQAEKEWQDAMDDVA